MRFPEKLRKGDCVGILCPSSPVKAERMDRCIESLKELGYRVKVGKSCYESYHGYLAGTDEVRAADINEMFANPEVRGIICARGGNGSGRLMHLLDYENIKRNPKVFVGYSDITNLLMAFNKLCGFVTYHGPMVSSNMVSDYDAYTKESFESLLAMEEIWEFRNPENAPMKPLVQGRARGILMGGNLSLISDMLGTFYIPDFDGKLLFLEDIHERVANVDRMIGQLRHLGVFERIAGLILGDFSESENSYDPSYDMDAYIRDEFGGEKFPVLYGLRAGHCHPTGSLPMGAVCELDTVTNRICFFRS